MSKINRNLITEIFRQKELMGIKQILSEGKGLDLIKDLFNISDAEPSFIKIFDDAMGEVKVSNPNLIQDIETNFNLNDISFSRIYLKSVFMIFEMISSRENPLINPLLISPSVITPNNTSLSLIVNNVKFSPSAVSFSKAWRIVAFVLIV